MMDYCYFCNRYKRVWIVLFKNKKIGVVCKDCMLRFQNVIRKVGYKGNFIPFREFLKIKSKG